MLWKILFFNLVDNTVYSYARYAINIEQGIPSFDEIKDVLEKRNFTQKSDDSNVWFHPAGLGVSIDLDVDGYLPEGYQVIFVDELATVVLPFVILGKKTCRMKSIMIQIFYYDGFRKNIHCLTEEEYVYHMKMYGFDPKKDGHKTAKNGKEIEYFIPKTRIIDDKIYKVREIIVDKNWLW